jgi:hypothetical protein
MEQELPTPDDDEALLGDLRRVTNELDPIPEHVLAAARAAIGWRTIDAELAELIADSAVDEPALLVRGATAPRSLTFEAPGLTIEIEAEHAGADDLHLSGQLVPPQPAEVTIRQGEGLLALRADERGRFAARGIAPGPLSLRCRLGGEVGSRRFVETAWMTI